MKGYRVVCAFGLIWACCVVVGCAPPLMSIDKLLEDGRTNEIMAHDGYSGEAMRVVGVVQAVGLQKFRRTEAEYGPEFGFTGFGTARVKQSRVAYAYVMLIPEQPEQGRLLCYFDPEDRREAGALSANQRVMLDGVFSQYRKSSQGLVAQLNHCSVVD